jgi:hypothetical protein
MSTISCNLVNTYIQNAWATQHTVQVVHLTITGLKGNCSSLPLPTTGSTCLEKTKREVRSLLSVYHFHTMVKLKYPKDHQCEVVLSTDKTLIACFRLLGFLSRPVEFVWKRSTPTSPAKTLVLKVPQRYPGETQAMREAYNVCEDPERKMFSRGRKSFTSFCVNLRRCPDARS